MLSIKKSLQIALMNGLYAYSIYALYALTILPFVSDFLNFGSKNILIGIGGFSILVFEFFATNYKLIRIRARSDLYRIRTQSKSGIDFIQNPPMLMLFGIFMRVCMRYGIWRLSIAALCPECYGPTMNTLAAYAMMFCFFIEFLGFLYLYVKTRIYIERGADRATEAEDIAEEKEWRKIHLKNMFSISEENKELASDIILNVFAIMIYTPIWQFVNQSGISLLEDLTKSDLSAVDATFEFFAFLLLVSFLALMPIRIVYWIQDSMAPERQSSVTIVWINFTLFCTVTFLPAIAAFFKKYYHLSFTWNMEHWPYLLQAAITPFLNMLLVTCEIIWQHRTTTKNSTVN